MPPTPRAVTIALFAIAAALAPTPRAAAEGGRVFSEFGTGRGLDARVAVTLLVDRDGLIWVGSREGLLLYDGYQARAFLPDPGQPGRISDIDVRNLYQSGDGALWVATNTGGLNRRDPRSGEFAQFHHDSADPRSLSDESVYGLAEDAQGRLWAGSQHGLNRLDADGRRFDRHFHDAARPDSLAADWVFALHRGPGGTLWVGTVGGGLDRWTGAGSSFEHFPLSTIAGGPRGLDDVFAVHETTDGKVWIGTRAGLVVLDPRRREAERIELLAGEGEQPLVTTMRADRAGRLWVGTLNHGVYAVDTATRRLERIPLPRADGSADPLSRPILSLATTEHLLIVGTWGEGVFRAPLDAPPFLFIARGPGDRGLRHENVTSVLAGDEPGRPWVGSFGGGPQRVDVEAGTVSPSGGAADELIRVSGVTSMAVTADGTRYAGSTDGLYRHGPDGRQLGLDAHVEGRADSIGRGYVTALMPSGDDLWVGVGGSGLFHRDAATGRFEAHRHDPAAAESLSGDFVTALLEATDGRIWVGTRSDGLNRCATEPFACERFDGRQSGVPDLGHHHVTALRPDRDGGLWVATSGGGLRRARIAEGGRVTGFDRWGVEQGLLSDGVMSAEFDSDGSLWVATRQGLSRLDPASGRVVNHVPQSGLPASHFNTGASSADSRYLYFGSVGGLVSVPKGLPMQPRRPSPVRITGVERVVGGRSTPLSPGALAGPLEFGIDDVLMAEFAVLDFTETMHEYSYRLHAGDAWIPLGHRRQLTFVGLSPGAYALEVRGRDAFGGWSASPPLDFEVVPPFWMTGWFRGVAIAAALLLAFALHRVRLRALSERNVVLERLKDEREEAHAGLRQLMRRLESAKEDERSRISRELHDDLGQTLTAAKLNLQMLRRSVTAPEVAGRLEDSVAMVDGMIRQARDIARGLRPPLLDEAGLVPALEHHLKLQSARSGTHIELDAEPGVARTPSDLDTTLFRLVQEAVGNALRHANAGVVRVTLRDEPDALSLRVEDDGVGFDPEAVARRASRGEHLGMLGMTERVRAAGGTIEFDSRPGEGCRIAVRIPRGERPDARRADT